MTAQGKKRTTAFSREHYHELSADETEARERGFESLGFPVEGPSLRKAEQEAEEMPPPPTTPGGEHVRPNKPGHRS